MTAPPFLYRHLSKIFTRRTLGFGLQALTKTASWPLLQISSFADSFKRGDPPGGDPKRSLTSGQGDDPRDEEVPGSSIFGIHGSVSARRASTLDKDHASSLPAVDDGEEFQSPSKGLAASLNPEHSRLQLTAAAFWRQSQGGCRVGGRWSGVEGRV